MRIIVLSDTHVPRMAKDIPKAVYEEIKKADMVLHAGDFAEISFLEKLRKLKKTIGVYGNMDSRELSSALKAKEIIEAGKFRIGLIHGWGASEGLTDRILGEFKGDKVDCIIFGHSHHPLNETIKKVLFFNPGSPTDKMFAPYNSYGILEVDEKMTAEIVKL